ncbi:MAG: hypothetical protein HY675_19815 [Chloroflexi bacterium]|nr:hypothetical protein [Chloroflexota bacterium]
MRAATWSRIVLILLAASILLYAEELELKLFNTANALLAVEIVVFGLLAFSLLILAARESPPRWINSYVLFAGCLSFLMHVGTLTSIQPYLVDTLATPQCAAELLLDGRHPYADFDMQRCLARFNMPESFATRLADGSVETKMPYPAGSFLFIAPFISLGVTDTRFVYAALMILMVLLIHHRADPAVKNSVVLALVSNVVVIRFTSGGLPEPLWALPLLVAWMWRDKSLLSSSALGAALATKQLAWFFVPFYLVMAGKEHGLREAARRASIAALIFVALNVPFAVSAPQLWADSLLSPLLDPMLPMGSGLIALGVSGVIPLWPKWVYVSFESLSFLAAIGWYYWRYARYKEAAVVLATLPLWFSWRSLLSYVYLNGFFLLAGIVHQRRLVQPAADDPVEATNRL